VAIALIVKNKISDRLDRIMSATAEAFPREKRDRNRKPDEARAPDLPLELFEAYFSCRRNKRNSPSALEFEVHFEREIWRLHDEIKSGTYRPGKCIAFIVEEPVKREVFASGFRDRVVHHWLIERLNPLFEQYFIRDSYACRPNKGNLYGIYRVARGLNALRFPSGQEGYVLKLDIRGFFMHINRHILYQKLEAFIHKFYNHSDRDRVLSISHQIIFHQPAANCEIRGSRSDWYGLPHDKSLFYAPPDCGLPIGNLSSQVFANFYLHEFDVFVRDTLRVAHYGRYVDDFVLLHPDRAYLNSLIPRIEHYLKTELGLTLHPKKRYLQHYGKGVTFLGVHIKPGRIGVAPRLKTQFYAALHRINAYLRQKRPLTRAQQTYVISCVNSYLGLMRWFHTFRLRRKCLTQVLNARWLEHLQMPRNRKKIRWRVDSPYHRLGRVNRKRGKKAARARVGRMVRVQAMKTAVCDAHRL
jgi:retron-type reverse transcriptase